MGGMKLWSLLERSVVVAALVAAVACTPSVAGAVRIAKPKIAGLSAAPMTVSSPSGYVHLSAAISGATSCTFTATTSVATFSPATVDCSSGAVASTLFVAQNIGRKPTKVRISLSATGPGGSRSSPLAVVVESGAGGRMVPEAPNGVLATASDGAASVVVMPPASNGGEPISSYTVTAVDLTLATNGGQTASGSTSPLTVAGLVDGDTYQFVVSATNEIGTGPLSSPSNAVVPDPVPGTPTGVTASAGDQQAAVSFLPPDNATPDTTYRVVATDLTTPTNGGETASGSTSPLTVAGLVDGDTYQFVVSATNEIGTGPLSSPSNAVVPDPVPGTPTGVTASAGDQQAAVSFLPPDNVSPDTTYRVVATDLTTPTNGGETASGSTSPLTVTGLTDGDTYTFSVTAETGTVEGAPSPASSPVIPAAGSLTAAQRAVVDGQHAYVAALNANPDLAQCSTDTNATARCSGIDYGTWYPVAGSSTDYYAIGNPQPVFDPTTHAADHLTVQVVGAAYDPTAPDSYDFQQETITLDPSNGFLDDLLWSNYESFSLTGNYSSCTYNWADDSYDVDHDDGDCGPVYFGPNDYLFGPVFSNDSIFVSNEGGGPSFGNANAIPSVPTAVRTADPNCLFVDDSHGMSGSDANCALADGDVAIFDVVNSSYGNPVEQPPENDSQLATAAQDDGCLYSGPTQISLSTAVIDGENVGEMTVTSPDTTEATELDDGTPVTWDTDNLADNDNDCPNDGTAPLPANGVVYVESATADQTVTGANPFDDYVANSATNLAASPASPTPGHAVTLTATVTSSLAQIGSGATVAFSQTTSTTTDGHTTTTTEIAGCASQANWSPPVQVGNNWQSTVTCETTEASNGTGAFSAVYSGGNYVNFSGGNLGQITSLTPGVTYGSESQTTAGGCSACYYGETSTPDAEGDAFVSGSLSGELTIGTQNNVIIDGNLTYADCSGQWTTGQSGEQDFCPYSVAGPNDSLGLVADQYVEVNHPIVNPEDGLVLPSCGGSPGALCDAATQDGALVDGSDRPGLTIDAAIDAISQSFLVNNYGSGSPEGTLALYGSVAQYGRGPIGTFSGGGSVSGYVKHYTWDPLLGFLTPPAYLNPSTSAWAIDPTSGDSGGSSTTCPPLIGIYGGTGGDGEIEDGPSITGYCSAPVGGLPDY